MAGPGMIPPVIVMPSVVDALAPSLRPGDVLQGSVQGKPGDLVLTIGSMRLPLNEAAQLLPGQAVTVEVTQSPTGLQLRVSPQVQPDLQGPASPPPPPLTALVTRVLESLGAIEDAETAAQLVPARLPLTEPAVRQILSLFLLRATTGDDLQAIQVALNRAAASGAVPQAVADEFAALAAPLVNADPSDVRRILQQLGAHAARTVEAHLARALTSGDMKDLVAQLQNDLRVRLSDLRGNEGLVRYLQGRGEIRGFRQAVARVLERLMSNQFQNLRATEQPYAFFEVPVPASGPFERAQIHVFGDGTGPRRGFNAKEATVVLDLSMTRLGDLWVSLSVAAGRCACRFKVTEPHAADAIRAGSGELGHALASVGYPGAHVHVSLWKGDRLRELAGLMRRFSGINVRA